MHRPRRVSLSLEPLEPRHLLAARPIISEFVADNAGSLADGDGQNSDWIEIYNAGDAAANLQGWYLTDDQDEPQKWPFPNVTLAAGEFLVVFASDQPTNNYVDAGGSLHTNFALASGGEYLALVQGSTVRHEFAPGYPSQLEDVAFGAQMETVALVGHTTALEYLAPTSDALEPAWRLPGFSHASLVTGQDVGASTVVISEANSDATDFVEIQNVSSAAVDTSGWTLVVNQAETPAVTSYSTIVSADPGVVSYWRLDENVGPQGNIVHGQAVVDRPGGAPDSFHGVAVFDTPFPNGNDGALGRVTNWQFFNNTPGTAGRLITPLLLEDVGVDQYMVRGIGTTRIVTEAGLQSWDFAAASGTDTFNWTLGRFHMGIRYGSPTVSNPGAVEFINAGNGWDFFGSATGAPNVVLNTQITGASSFDNLGRDYSVQYTIVPAAGTGGTPVTAIDDKGLNNGQYTTAGVLGNRPGALVGDASKAADFTGGELTVPHSASLNFGGAAMSVEAWVQVDSIGAPRWIVSKDSSDASVTPGLDYQLGIDTAGRFVFRSQSTAQSVFATAPATTGATWHHVVGVQDSAAGNIRLYVNGVLQGTAPLTTTGVAATTDLKIGDRGGLGGNQNFDGRIDEVAIYNRALATGDVALHYQAGSAALTGGLDRVNPIAWPLPQSMAAGSVLVRTDNPADSYFGSDIAWPSDGPGWALLLDDSREVVDFVAWGYSQSQLDGLALAVGGESIPIDAKWSGPGATAAGGGAQSLQRHGNRDHDTASDFARLAPTPGAVNPGVITPFLGELVPISGGIGYARDDGGLGNGEMVGPPVVDRAVTDGASGSIFLLDNYPFTQNGRVNTWSMFSTNGLRITPLILREQGGEYEITGIGQSRISAATGLQTFDFNLQSGSDLVGSGYYFGFKDGDNAIDNTGVIDWDDGTADTIRWFGGGRAGSVVLGASFADGQTFPRTYSLRASTISTIEGEIDIDVEPALYNQRTSLYVRYPFEASGPGSVSSLTLHAKYDDGFVAYLNGIEVARRNVPGTTTFASTAVSDRPVNDAGQFDPINFTPFAGLLLDGANVLAIHGFNDAATSGDFLIEAQLTGAGLVDPPASGYFQTPTPGGPNGSPLGGYVGDTIFDHDRGFYSTPFDVTISAPQTPDATIYYTTDGTDPAPTNAAAQLYASPITIDRTTTLRAAGHKQGYIPSNIDTHTYVFVADVVQQSVISPAIRNHAVWGPRLDDALLEIPTISLVTSNTISVLEEATSIELIHPDGTPGFQADAGVEKFGNTSLGFQKNSMRISFKRQYGPAKLRHDIFGGDATEEFDQFLLRSSHDSQFYTHVNGTRGVYLRNRWISDRHREMGQPGPHSRFVHVYVNGTYQGMYDLMERPNAGFMEAYFGGQKEDYDAFHDGEVIDGNSQALDALASGTASWSTIQQYLDVENYADYMLTQFYGGNDWDWNHFQNWMAARKREPGAGFKFFHWDNDMILRTSPTANVVNRGGPRNMWSGIVAHPEFRQVLADRAQRLFGPGGVLTPPNVATTLAALHDELATPIIAEAARWGGGGYTPDTWQQNYDNLVAGWASSRTATVIQQLRDSGYFPANDAPEFFVNGQPRHGGAALSGDLLTITAPGTTTTITTNLVSDTSSVSALVPANDNLADAWWSHTFVQGAAGETWLTGQNGVGYDRDANQAYRPKIRIDTEPLMFGGTNNTSVYVRIPFTIADQVTIDSFDALALRVAADDGFVAFLNGVEVASANAPGRGGHPLVLDWNSRAPVGTEIDVNSPAVFDLTSRRQISEWARMYSRCTG